ncbi:MAG TPA: zinc ribbon domain-containing protein [Xanthomonadaceae bacterium]|jgi:ABC-type nickel/cobalt efflux system permease component RcnA
MAACPKCNAAAAVDAKFCSACGARVAGPDPSNGHHLAHTVSAIFAHIPHPHIHHRKKNAPKTAQEHQPEPGNPITRFNAWFAVKVTDSVGTMWCAYAFAALALVSLPDAVKGGTATLVAWVAQTFIQLVLLSIIIVGQKVAGEASDKRAIDTYNDAEALLHEAVQIQQHLAAQDAFLQRLIDELCQKKLADEQSANADRVGGSATPG